LVELSSGQQVGFGHPFVVELSFGRVVAHSSSLETLSIANTKHVPTAVRSVYARAKAFVTWATAGLYAQRLQTSLDTNL
jgi:hypothetical protein